MTETALAGKIQDALRHQAPLGRYTEGIGPFLATFTRSTDSAVDGLRRVADGGGIVLLARDVATGEPAGAGLCTPPHEGVTELTSIAVRSAFRRRGIAAALTNRLARAALERGMKLVFLMAAGADEARIYARAGFVERGDVLHISHI